MGGLILPRESNAKAGSACSAVEEAHSGAGQVRRGEAEKVTPP
jgi:hypothetical protein